MNGEIYLNESIAVVQDCNFDLGGSAFEDPYGCGIGGFKRIDFERGGIVKYDLDNNQDLDRPHKFGFDEYCLWWLRERGDRFANPNIVENVENNLGEKKNIEYIKENCDILVITASLTNDTKNLLNSDFFNSLGKKPYIVNVSRGSIINEKDLIDALEEELISGCALDVFEGEPINKDSQFKKFENVVFSSHNASNTQEANHSVNSQVTKILLKWLGYD